MQRHGIAGFQALVLAQPGEDGTGLVDQHAAAQGRPRPQVGQVRRALAGADSGDAVAGAAAGGKGLPCCSGWCGDLL
jgi:hypothetical protein